MLRLGRGYTTTASLSPDGALLALARLEGVYLCSLPTDPQGTTPLVCEAYLPHASPVRRVIFSPDGNRLATIELDGNLWLWDLTAPSPQSQALDTDDLFQGLDAGAIARHTESADLAFSADGRYLAAAAGHLALWDLDNGQPIPLSDPAHPTDSGASPEWVSVAFAPEGYRLIAGAWSGDLLFLEADHPATARRLPPSYEEAITDLAFTPQGDLLAVYRDDSLALLSAEDGSLRTHWPVPGQYPLVARFHSLGGNNALTRTLLRVLGAYPFQGDALLTGSGSGQVLRFSLSSQSLSRALERPFQSSQSMGVPNVLANVFYENVFASFTPDGQRIVAVWGDGTVDLWDAQSEQVISEAADSALQGEGVTFDPLGRSLLSSDRGDGWRWDLATGQATSHGGRYPASLSPDGCYRLSYRFSIPDTLEVYRRCQWPPSREIALSVEQEGLLSTFPIRPAWPGAGLWLAIAPEEEGLLYLLDPDTGDVIHTLQDPTLPQTFDLTADPQDLRIYQASAGGNIGLWDAAEGRLEAIWHLEAPLRDSDSPDIRSRIIALALSANGDTLVSSRNDGLLAIWETSGGTPRTLTPDQLDLPATAVLTRLALSADGHWLFALAKHGEGLWIIDLQKGETVAHIPTYGDAFTDAFALSPDERLLAVTGAQAATTVWSVPDILSEITDEALLPEPILPEAMASLPAFHSRYTVTLRAGGNEYVLLDVAESARRDVDPPRRHFQVRGQGWPAEGEGIWNARPWMGLSHYAFRTPEDENWYTTEGGIIPPVAPLLRPWGWQATGLSEGRYRYTAQDPIAAVLPPMAWIRRALGVPWATFTPQTFSGETILAPDGLLTKARLTWQGRLRTPQGEEEASLETLYRLEDTTAEEIPLPLEENVTDPLNLRPAGHTTPEGIPLPEDAIQDEDGTYLTPKPAADLLAWYQEQLPLFGFTVLDISQEDMGGGFFSLTMYSMLVEKDGQRYTIYLTSVVGFTNISVSE